MDDSILLPPRDILVAIHTDVWIKWPLSDTTIQLQGAHSVASKTLHIPLDYSAYRLSPFCFIRPERRRISSIVFARYVRRRGPLRYTVDES